MTPASQDCLECPDRLDQRVSPDPQEIVDSPDLSDQLDPRAPPSSGHPVFLESQASPAAMVRWDRADPRACKDPPDPPDLQDQPLELAPVSGLTAVLETENLNPDPLDLLDPWDLSDPRDLLVPPDPRESPDFPDLMVSLVLTELLASQVSRVCQVCLASLRATWRT